METSKKKKKIGDGVFSANCDAMVIFWILGQFGAIRKPDSGCMVGNTYIFISSNFVSYKHCKQN